MPSSRRFVLMVRIVAANGSSPLAGAPLVNTESTTVTVNVSAGSIEELPLRCRDFSTLISTTALPHDQKNGTIGGMEPTDAQGPTLTLGPGAYPGVPAGALFTFVNGSLTTNIDFTAQITCAQYTGLTSTIVAETSIAPGSFGSTLGTCPQGEYAFGGGYRYSRTVKLSRYFTYSTGAGLEDRPTGVNPPPDSYQYEVFN